MKTLKLVAICSVVLLGASCSTVRNISNTAKDIFTIEKVKPWERGILAEQDMQLVDDPLMTYADDHIYFSKEAATGGKGVGGGGCGCN